MYLGDQLTTDHASKPQIESLEDHGLITLLEGTPDLELESKLGFKVGLI